MQTAHKSASKKAAWPKIRKRINTAGTVSWCVDPGLALGKRQRFFFLTKTEAETKADMLRVVRANQGTAGLSISDDLRVEAARCQKRLAAVSASLTDATEYFLRHAMPGMSKKTVTAILADFLAEKKEDGCRPEYLRVQKAVLGKFAATFGERWANEVRGDEIAAWMRGQEWTPRTRRNYISDLGNFFGFALKKKLVGENPIASVGKPKVDETTPGILAPAQVESLLSAAEQAGGEMVPYIALGLFAGIRSEELGKLQWSAVDLERGTVTIGAEIAKKRRTRYVTMSENLRAWLKGREGIGAIRPTAWRYQWAQVRADAGIVDWPKNAMRHSFASYHFAAHLNAPQTAAELGHRGDTDQLFEHYRALATRADAEKFWVIMPKAAPGRNVVKFKAA